MCTLVKPKIQYLINFSHEAMTISSTQIYSIQPRKSPFENMSSAWPYEFSNSCLNSLFSWKMYQNGLYHAWCGKPRTKAEQFVAFFFLFLFLDYRQLYLLKLKGVTRIEIWLVPSNCRKCCLVVFSFFVANMLSCSLCLSSSSWYHNHNKTIIPCQFLGLLGIFYVNVYTCVLSD